MFRLLYRVFDRFVCIVPLVLLSLYESVVSPFRKPVKGTADRILIIKLSALGDTLMMIPILRALRISHPELKITALVSTLNEAALEHCPDIDQLRILDLGNPLKMLRTVCRLRRQGIAIAVDFEQRIKLSPFIAYFSGASERVGFTTKGYFRDFLYTRKILHRQTFHEFECMVGLTRHLTGEIADTRVEVQVSGDDEKWAREFIARNDLEGKKLLFLHPGCGARFLTGARAREWPKENFIELADILGTAMRVIVTGGKDETALTEEICVRSKSGAINLGGKTSVGKLAALLKKGSLLVSADTGIMHLGAACGIKTIAVFGPTDPRRCHPLSGEYQIVKSECKCMPCQVFGIDQPGCAAYTCMKNVGVQQVLDAVKR